MTNIEAIEILEEIKTDYIKAFDGDPMVRRCCNVIINEFKERTKTTETKQLIPSVSVCCSADTIPPDWEMVERMGSLWRAYACHICKKCNKVCEVVND